MQIKHKPFIFKLVYSDGGTRTEEFDSMNQAYWFIMNEGDHLRGYERVYIDEPSVKVRVK